MSLSLEAQNLVQRQGQNLKGQLLFSDLNFSWIGPGIQVIMGPSGQGKSSLLKSIGGVWKPSSGRLLMGGQSLWASQLYIQNTVLLNEVGFTFQNNALFSSLRVIDNLCFPYQQKHPNSSREEQRMLAMEWLGKVGLEAQAEHFPHELSGGMQKRLALARTLILKPSYLYLDDPTAGLDPITSKDIAKMLDHLLAELDALVVIVTNDPDRAQEWGPHIHFLCEGQLISPDCTDYAKTKRRFL